MLFFLLENFLNFLASQLLPLPEQDPAKTSLSLQKYLLTFLDRIISCMSPAGCTPYLFQFLPSSFCLPLLFSSFPNQDRRSQNLPHLSRIREMAFCLFARRKTETLPEELCKSFANCKTNQQRFTFPLLRKEYFKRDCQAEKPNIGKHILQLCY